MSPHQTASRSFRDRYLDGEFDDLFRLSPNDPYAALETPRDVDRSALAAALERYARDRGAPEAVFAALDKLRHPESRAVVTGQQVGLLLGPTFTLSKAVTALKLAEQLNSDERPVVAVFWLATQDHDSGEIDHSYLLDFDETLHRLELPLPTNTPAGRVPLNNDWVTQVIDELDTLHTGEPFYRDVCERLQRSAEAAQTYADWFAGLLYDLLGDQGLIILDPLQPDLAPLFKDVMAHEVRDPLRSSEAINRAADALRDRGLTPQLGRAEQATNLFVETGAGQRQLLRFEDGSFRSDDAEFSPDALLAFLDASPSRLTPAAGLRPITQDAVLPTALTVVGPGELRYFSQIKGVYAFHDIAMPLIWPRATVTVLEPPVHRILDKFELSHHDIQQRFTEVRDEILLELHGHADMFDSSLTELERLADTLVDHVREIDPTLERTVRRGEGYLETTFETLRDKSAKALAKQDDIYSRQFERLRVHLLPEDTPQERLLSPFSFFLKFGAENVLRAFLELEPHGDHTLRF